MMLTRRQLLLTAAASTGSTLVNGQAPSSATARVPFEFSFTAGSVRKDPFHEVDLDVAFTGPSGEICKMPAFWSGGANWNVRFAAPRPGRWTWLSVCNDTGDRGLHGRSGSIVVQDVPATGNALLRHGPLTISKDQRRFVHEDGTPFFWLGDTWWMGLTRRLVWPDEFATLASDRVRKGFSVIQIVGGLYPDMPPFDERGANEAGLAWEKGYTRINPRFFDLADERMRAIVDRGFVPCIYGAWGFHLPRMGVAKMKRHWRYLIGRWGSLPVLWSAAGEVNMPFYTAENPNEERAAMRKGWIEVIQYIRDTDPYHRPLSATTTAASRPREFLGPEANLDFELLQTGHADRSSISNTVNRLVASRRDEPTKPALVAEVTYEGIGEASREEVQRFMFWASILNGAAGHTYGANGIWQLNRRGQPFGPSPHGQAWGETPWDEAANLPGSRQLGLAKELLTQYLWHRMEPLPNLVQPYWTTENYHKPYAAGIAGELYIVYLPAISLRDRVSTVTLSGFLQGSEYKAFYWNPSDGSRRDLPIFRASASGAWESPRTPVIRDWVLVVQKI